MSNSRIAILGFAIESNRFAPVATRADFIGRAYLGGEQLLADARSPAPAITPEIPAFIRRMDHHGAWTPVPILFANAESGGPVDHAFFAETLAEMERGLRSALPLDAVYICEHGAAITTAEDDPDGMVFEMVRSVVITTLVESPSSLSWAVTTAAAFPLPLVSLPLALSTTRCAAASFSTNAASPL